MTMDAIANNPQWLSPSRNRNSKQSGFTSRRAGMRGIHPVLALELIGEGMPEAQARAQAHRKFGNMNQQSEQAQATWIAQWFTDLTQDLRYAFRGMRRDAGFATFVILIIGLGIGANTAIFSLINAVVLKTLPVSHPEELVELGRQTEDGLSFTNPIWEQGGWKTGLA
jgi:hypothetical protein